MLISCEALDREGKKPFELSSGGHWPRWMVSAMSNKNRAELIICIRLKK